MKRILSLILSAALTVSMIPAAYATHDYEQGTKVEYVANSDANKEYTITVPALLNPGQEGVVTLKGKWASNETIKVTADKTVELTNSINTNDKHVLGITFLGIEKAGDNTAERTYTEKVSVENMPSNALFGTWSGKFNYNVESVNIVSESDCITLNWDGNTDGLSCGLSTSFDGNNLSYYKVSDVVPTFFQNGITIEITFGDEKEGGLIPYEEFEEAVLPLENNEAMWAGFYFLVVPYDNCSLKDDMGETLMTFPEKGIYLYRNDMDSGDVYYITSLIIHGKNCNHDLSFE